MNLTTDEKQLLLHLAQQEYAKFEKDEDSIIFQPPAFLALEEKYEEFLERLIQKLEE